MNQVVARLEKRARWNDRIRQKLGVSTAANRWYSYDGEHGVNNEDILAVCAEVKRLLAKVAELERIAVEIAGKLT